MATPADADIILKLYDLRREETMRKARSYVSLEFWPGNVEEFKAIHQPTNANNAYWRQVVSFWEMAATLALHGGVDAELFLDTQGEGMFVRSKFAELSEEATGNPFMPQTLKLIESSEAGRKKYAGTSKNVAALRAMKAAQAK